MFQDVFCLCATVSTSIFRVIRLFMLQTHYTLLSTLNGQVKYLEAYLNVAFFVFCCRAKRPAARSNENWQERMWYHPSSFFWKTTFLNPRGVPRGYQDSMFRLSLSLFLLLVTLPRSRLLKNKLVVCLTHTVRLCSGSSPSGTDVIRLRHERTVSQRKKTLGVSLFPFHRIYRHQQKEWRTEVCPQCFVVKGRLLLETS